MDQDPDEVISIHSTPPDVMLKLEKVLVYVLSPVPVAEAIERHLFGNLAS